MSKHTLGPWKVIEGMNGWQVWAGDIQIIDYVLEEADARLIAAGPLLLAAIKLLIKRSEFDLSVEEIAISRTAIAAAEGEE